jgi:ComF family protein
MKGLARGLWLGLADILFPSLCEHCGRPASASVPLCWRCVTQLERVDDDQSRRVLADLPVGNENVSLKCLWYFDRDSPLRDVVHSLKYQNRPWHGQFLGRSMALSFGLGSSVGAVVPLPLHDLRRLERGYNQSAWIASGIALEAGIPLVGNALQRTRPTRTQTALTREERWENVRDAFRVRPAGAHSTPLRKVGHVLLVDDVVTTGATGLSAALTLQQAGVRAVTIAACGLARA